MKRERLEEIGAIRVMLKGLLDEYDFFERATSKHSLDSFLEFYGNSNNLEDLHDQIRYANEQLTEIYYLAMGDNDYTD